jgi:sterol desaturase/sphingolipid hydroxylase (fatty acid hydroxylase superfamily)
MVFRRIGGLMEHTLRLSIFLGVFAIMAAAEFLRPRRMQNIRRIKRWPQNIALVVLDALIVRFIFPVSLIGFSLMTVQHGWGLFSLLQPPFWLTVIVSLISLDFIIYWQHVLFHKVPFLWRLHRVHHTDTEFDVTTALRFHPFEIMISMGIKFAAIILLGIPPEAALLFEIILNASAMFNHGNINLPTKIDYLLRYILVTPDMHRVHHSTIPLETNSNYGFNIPIWDRLFRSYSDQPIEGHQKMRIGLDQFREAEDRRLDKMLLQPFR